MGPRRLALGLALVGILGCGTTPPTLLTDGAGEAPDGRAGDLPAAGDLSAGGDARAADLASPDLAAADLAGALDLGVADLAPGPDLTVAADLVTTADLSEAPDRSAAPDLLPPPDLTPSPDLTSPPRCDDGTMNGDETDVDCGGPRCGRCGDGKRCAVAGDCGSRVCKNGACEVASCGDGVRNGGETDLDCGGAGCPGCGERRACLVDGDCAAKVCQGGRCAALLAGSVMLSPPRSAASASAGGSKVSVQSSVGFAVGQSVLLHQTQGRGAGAWEEAEIAAVDSAISISLKRPLVNAYSSGIGNDRAQLVGFLEYGDLVVDTGATVTGPAWDGQSGGVLPIRADGGFTVRAQGRLHVDGRGFRGAGRNGIVRDDNGVQGESPLGPGGKTTAQNRDQPNGSGGCGGYQERGRNGTGGGGGGHGGVGGASRANAYNVPGVSGGLAVGGPNLAQIFLGGAGGEGAHDEDGFVAGGGGAGGGLLYVRAGSATLVGALSAAGTRGGDGVQTCNGCGGSGMAGGGGGAGGTIYLLVGAATVAPLTLVALGGAAGQGTENNPGGAGGGGRIRVDFALLNGQAPGSNAANQELAKASEPDAFPGR